MNPWLVLLLGLAGLLVSAWLTGLLCRYALCTQQAGKPNERSSHTQPTLCGAGGALFIAAEHGC